MAGGQVAHALEVAGLGQDDVDVHHRRLQDQRGDLPLVPDQRSLERVEVVEGHDARELDDRLRIAGAVGDARRVLARAELIERRAHGDHHGVVMAVVRALDLQQDVATRRAAREMHAAERGLGARVGEAPVRQAEAAAQLLRDRDRALGGRGEVAALVDLALDGGRDLRVRVPEAHDAEAVVEVDVLVAVDVPDRCPLAALEIHRARLARLEGRGHAVGHDDARPLVERVRARGARQEALALALGQLRDAAAVDVGGEPCLDAHASSVARGPASRRALSGGAGAESRCRRARARSAARGRRRSSRRRRPGPRRRT